MGQLNQHIGTRLHDIRVVLNYGPLGFVQAVTERIGRNQIQLNTGTINLNHSAEVEIVMSIPDGEFHQHHRIAAQVIHCGEEGSVTLGYDSCCKETMQALIPYLTLH